MTGSRSIGRPLRIAAIPVLVLISIGILIWIYGFFGPGGVTEQKSIFGAMQGVEIEYRGRKLNTPFFLDVKSGSYSLRLVALATNDSKFPYAWLELSRQLRLDDSPHNFYMVAGEGKIRVSCEDVNRILMEEKVAPAVAAFLKQQCKP
jgi:hypothetical protein